MCSRHPDRLVLAKGLCSSCYQIAWRKTRPGYYKNWYAKMREDRPRDYRNRSLRSKYGITLEKYEEMTIAQAGRCAICQKELELLHVDHDAVTGEVRGLLCGNCNRGIGLFHESAESLRMASSYVSNGGYKKTA